MLDRLSARAGCTANGVVGLFPANAVGDDIEVYTDETRARGAHACCTTCASRARTATACRTAPSPTSSRPRRPGCRTTSGAFAVTAGLGMREQIEEFKADLDDYSAILLESLADRLAEAFAERMHERVRRELWGYAPDEHLATRRSSGSSTPASAPRPATPPAPTTPRSSRSGRCST